MTQDSINHPTPLRRLLFLLVIVLLAPVPGSSEAPPHLELSHLQIRDRRIVDDRGSTVILRGVAVNQLGDYFQANPQVPSTMPLTRKDFEGMAALGLDSVRLVVSWSLLEPEPGVHDEAYLARVRQAVDWARVSGIYVILDMHQDAWGKYIGTAPDQQCRPPLSPNIGWDGAPEWATITDGKSRCMFVHREFSAAGFRAWQAFWEDRDGIQQHLIDTWAWLAAAFKDDPAVAGYDLLNEPNWGENYVAAVRKYKPAFYRRAVKAIRQAEAGGLTKLIFFEPIAVWSALPGEKPVVFTDDPNIVYAPHIYLGSISVDVFLFHRELIPLRKGFEIAKKEADEYNTTFWNGEWLPGPGDHAWRYAALEDEYQIGGARWIWKSACGDPHQMSRIWPDRDTILTGTGHATIITRCGDPDFPAGADLGVNPIDAEVLARPYPRAFPSPAVYTSDPKTRDFRISGTAPRAGIPLLVWFPGNDEPQVETANVEGMQIEQVDGGWLLNAAPGAGQWSLHAATASPPLR